MNEVNIGEGRKDDTGKLRWDLVPMEQIEKLVEVMTFGAKKYEANNWQKVGSERYVSALFRHLIAWRKGEQCDPETGLTHLAHALTNVLFLMWKDDNNGK